MWTVRLVEQRTPYGPIADREVADRFAAFLTAEVDPARVEPFHGRTGERLHDPVTELLDWRDHVTDGTRPRTVCPVCDRDVVRRKNGSPATHYPPPDRRDLACGEGPFPHCRGSHPADDDTTSDGAR